MTTEKLHQAAQEYIARRDRQTNPDGKFDSKGRWYPSDAERCDCCNSVRSPSRAYPYSYMVHCRTITHVANLYGVTESDLRKEVRRLEPPAKPERLGGENFYKAVAVVDGKFVSIFDGQTEYILGQELKQVARQEHNGGYYVYRSVSDAENVQVPSGSALRNAPRAILRIKAQGNYCKYDNGKIAFSRVTPLEVIQA